MIITDGWPWMKSQDQLRSSIIECSTYLRGKTSFTEKTVCQNHNYERIQSKSTSNINLVARFYIDQIETDEDVADFMKSVEADISILWALLTTDK
jgi:hypothetical protein